jgi:hypothetical protein
MALSRRLVMTHPAGDRGASESDPEWTLAAPPAAGGFFNTLGRYRNRFQKWLHARVALPLRRCDQHPVCRRTGPYTTPPVPAMLPPGPGIVVWTSEERAAARQM